jgi:hypothetical protein
MEKTLGLWRKRLVWIENAWRKRLVWIENAWSREKTLDLGRKRLV